MLTKKDLEQIEWIVQGSIKAAFQDFYEHMFEPHVTQSLNQHKEIVTEIVALKQEIKGLKDKTGEITEFIKDHEKRITHLETVSLL